MTAHTPAWRAVPDAVGIAGQWRPADLRGLPATLRYGASLPGVALAAARGRPRTVVLVDDGGPVLGRELEAAVDAVAAELARAVRRTGRRDVVVLAAGTRDTVAAVTAAGALGLDLLLVSPRAGSGTVAETVRDTVVVVDGSTARLVGGLVPDEAVVDLRDAVRSSPGRSLRSVPRPRHPGVLRLLTSGTTGAPRPTERGAAGAGQLATLLSLLRALGLRRDEPVIVAPPLAHGHGLSVLTAALVVGAPAVLAPGADGTRLVELAREHRAGVLAAVPAQLVGVLEALVDGPAAGLTALRRVATGSAPLPADLVARTHRVLGEILVDFYGSSETGTATIARPEDLRDAPGTVGRPAAGVRVAVVDEAGVPVPVGEVGDVVVRSPWRAVTTPPGDVAVGDRGHLDAHGRLFLDGRSDDVVVVGGHNVSVTRVREWFASRPGVRGAAVEVVPHDVLGRELVVVVRGDVDPDGLARDARAALGEQVAPRRVVRAAE